MGERNWWGEAAFWADLEAVMFDEERLARAGDEVRALLALTGTPPRSRVLDLPCGPGRHAVELARLEHRVTGVDLTRRFVEAARERALAAGVEVELLEGDMRSFDRPGAFDLALSLWSSVGYFEEDAENRAVLERFHVNLAPGGRLVVDVKGREVIELLPRRRELETGGGRLVETSTLVGDRVEIAWQLERDGVSRERSFSLRTYRASELCELLEVAGFTDVTVHGNLAGGPYEPEEEDRRRLVAVARRRDR